MRFNFLEEERRKGVNLWLYVAISLQFVSIVDTPLWNRELRNKIVQGGAVLTLEMPTPCTRKLCGHKHVHIGTFEDANKKRKWHPPRRGESPYQEQIRKEK